MLQSTERSELLSETFARWRSIACTAHSCAVGLEKICEMKKRKSKGDYSLLSEDGKVLKERLVLSNERDKQYDVCV